MNSLRAFSLTRARSIPFDNDSRSHSGTASGAVTSRRSSGWTVTPSDFSTFSSEKSLYAMERSRWLRDSHESGFNDLVEREFSRPRGLSRPVTILRFAEKRQGTEASDILRVGPVRPSGAFLPITASASFLDIIDVDSAIGLIGTRII